MSKSSIFLIKYIAFFLSLHFKINDMKVDYTIKQTIETLLIKKNSIYFEQKALVKRHYKKVLFFNVLVKVEVINR